MHTINHHILVSLRLVLALVLLAFSISTKAQTLDRKVISSCGSNYESPTISVSSTLGEPFISTFEVPSKQWTQGFQQSYPSKSSIRLFIQGYYEGAV